MMKWSEEETIRFVELYREKECLWKKSSAKYGNKNMRKAAEEDVVTKMGKQSFGVTELKQKIKIIRTTYNQEVFKIKKSKKSRPKSKKARLQSLTEAVKAVRKVQEMRKGSVIISCC